MSYVLMNQKNKNQNFVVSSDHAMGRSPPSLMQFSKMPRYPCASFPLQYAPWWHGDDAFKAVEKLVRHLISKSSSPGQRHGFKATSSVVVVGELVRSAASRVRVHAWSVSLEAARALGVTSLYGNLESTLDPVDTNPRFRKVAANDRDPQPQNMRQTGT